MRELIENRIRETSGYDEEFIDKETIESLPTLTDLELLELYDSLVGFEG